MKKTRSLLPALALLLPTLALSAEEFEDVVPVELVRMFLGASGLEVGLYRDIPDDFPDLELPAALNVLGSVDRRVNQVVYLRLEEGSPRAAADDALRESLEAAAWVALPDPGNRATQRGFINPGQPGLPQQFCHEDHGLLSLSWRSADDGEYLQLSRNTQAVDALRGCELQIQARQGGGAYMPGALGLQEHMPRLELPGTDQTPPALASFGAGIRSSSGRAVESETSLQGDWSLEDLYRHFADQLEAQNWDEDSDWQGSFLRGGAWLKTTEEGEELVGLLTILNRGEDNFDLGFRLLPGSGSADSTMNILRRD